MGTSRERSQSAALHRRVCAFVEAYERGAPMPEPFEGLALRIAVHQAESSPPYARLLAARGLRIDDATTLRALPAVPTDAFKAARIATFADEDASVVFRTSGTTIGARGEHWLADVRTYDRAACAFGRTHLVPPGAGRVPVVVLGPSPREAPDSSLSHMNAKFVEVFGSEGREQDVFVVDDGTLDLAAFDRSVSRALALGDEAMLVLGTSFAFVHLLDALEDAPFPLPKGSVVMQTGGFKGRSRTVEPDALRAALADAFAIDRRQIVGEYGMTELGSQFYERTYLDASAPEGVYVEPPWARVEAVDPVSLEPVAFGEVGLARIIDLVNVDSAVVVQTQDRVRRVAGGFELLGRMEGAAPRGCSIAIDELLGARREP